MKSEPVFVNSDLFLRYLTNDSPSQADAVEKLLHQAGQGKLKLVTNSLVIAEVVLTLENTFQLERADIQNKAIAILNTKGLEVIDGDLVLKAIFWYGEKNVDFLDAFHIAWMLKNNLNKVYTFEQAHFQRFGGIASAVTPK